VEEFGGLLQWSTEEPLYEKVHLPGKNCSKSDEQLDTAAPEKTKEKSIPKGVDTRITGRDRGRGRNTRRHREPRSTASSSRAGVEPRESGWNAAYRALGSCSCGFVRVEAAAPGAGNLGLSASYAPGGMASPGGVSSLTARSHRRRVNACRSARVMPAVGMALEKRAHKKDEKGSDQKVRSGPKQPFRGSGRRQSAHVSTVHLV
jgi:hypothetical protein